MIYALLSESTPQVLRQEIARAVLSFENLTRHVVQGTIVHVLDAQPGSKYHCIYCQRQVRLSRRNPQGQPR